MLGKDGDEDTTLLAERDGVGEERPDVSVSGVTQRTEKTLRGASASS